ncbi:putative MFS family arabinose efflux permease [Lacrimispora xylanisolvens]|jgi:MFS family permease|uniref:Putative MFS family arabinose efflux permease n=1 Tax=Lacrimispora xylanisolvens TaxID=384636 RepID=A0A2S6HXG9_9FIRM|nr:MFS transporter [Hungatella xylanolytica]MBE5987922.1 MFS transporter [Paenibacillaceae bacterium]PPK82700.1 putative MFS family arabinose efflux permease [Hungatella xylanolytica]
MKYEKVALSIILVSLPCLVFDFLLPAYTTELGYTVFQLSILYSVYSFSELVMRLLIGKISDRYSRFLVLCCAMLLYGIAYFLFSQARGLGYLLAARMVQGAAGILLTISAVSLITAEKTSFAKGLGRYGGNRQLGGIIGIGLTFYVLKRTDFLEGWSQIFLISSAFAVVSLILLFIKKPSHASEPASRTGKVVYTPLEQKIWMLNLLYCIPVRLVGVLVIPYMMEAYHTDMQAIGFVFMLPVILTAFLSPRIGQIGDKLGYKKTIFSATLIAAAFMVLLVFSPNLQIFAIVWTLYQIALTAQDYSLDALFVQGVPEQVMGDFYGKYMLSTSLGGIIGPFIGGSVSLLAGGKAPYFLCAVFLTAISILVWKLIPAGGKSERNVPGLTENQDGDIVI